MALLKVRFTHPLLTTTASLCRLPGLLHHWFTCIAGLVYGYYNTLILGVLPLSSMALGMQE